MLVFLSGNSILTYRKVVYFDEKIAKDFLKLHSELLNLASVGQSVCLKKMSKMVKNKVSWLFITFSVYSNIRTSKVYMLVIAYDPDPTISGALHG